MSMKIWMCSLMAVMLMMPRALEAQCCKHENVVPHQMKSDSMYIKAYSTSRSKGQNGLHLAWSRDAQHWFYIGPEYSVVKSDYGTWGREKRMLTPVLSRDERGVFECCWLVNENDSVVAYTRSSDLIYWLPQDYYTFAKAPKMANGVDIKNLKSKDARRASVVEKAWQRPAETLMRVEWSVVDNLLKHVELSKYRSQLNAEVMKDDLTRFADLKTVEVSIAPNVGETKNISDMLMGVFFEDINYAADGGLYAELIQNRDFEYTVEENKGRTKGWGPTYAWHVSEGATLSIGTTEPIHENNSHYAVVKTDKAGATLVNEGWDGIVLKAGEKYDLSLFLRLGEGALKVRLVDSKGVIAETTLKAGTAKWVKRKAVLTASRSSDSAQLELVMSATGESHFDMVSLFPQNTFKKRKNGMRADIAQVIADLKPRFVRFPGGCVAHGDGIDNIYRWKNTIGELHQRKPMANIWRYHQSVGLGYFEYFQFCEDIGAEPLPVIAAGVPCQNSQTGGSGQQGGIPMADMEDYLQDILDLIEWANGDPKTSKWAKMRADAGHKEPFGLKYIGIGNEDLISETFLERYLMLIKGVKAKYPDITVIGTVGPWCEGSDYERGWQIAKENKIDMVDEHYYQSPGWFINNQDYYDKYSRNTSKVYLGEYASHLPKRPSNIETALSEAIYLLSVERNADVVTMTSYAPLLAKKGHTQWTPDLIYFTNTEVLPTVNYEVQRLYGQNAGNQYVPSLLTVNTLDDKVLKRVACSIVKDSETNEMIVKIANLLPVDVNVDLDWSALGVTSSVVKKYTLSGEPTDSKAKVVESSEEIQQGKKMVLGRYSFVVLRVK